MHVLDLGNNSISREGASALAAYMKKSTGLKELNMYMNDIGTAGITEVRHEAPLRMLCLVLAHAHHSVGCGQGFTRTGQLALRRPAKDGLWAMRPSL